MHYFKNNGLVRKWLMSTFTNRKNRSTKRDGSRKGLKGVVTGISAALRMERMFGSKKEKGSSIEQKQFCP